MNAAITIYGLLSLATFGYAFGALRMWEVTLMPSTLAAIACGLVWPAFWLAIAYWWWH